MLHYFIIVFIVAQRKVLKFISIKFRMEDYHLLIESSSSVNRNNINHIHMYGMCGTKNIFKSGSLSPKTDINYLVVMNALSIAL